MLVWITGPVVVAFVIAVLSPSAAVLLVAAVCVLGTAFFLRSPLAGGTGSRPAHTPRSSALADRGLRLLLAPVALTGLALGAIEVGLPSLALHDGSRTASGILLALWSAGSMVGGLLYGTRRWRSTLTGRYRLLLVAAIACSAPLIIARSIPAAIVGSILSGLTIAPVFSCQYALIGQLVRPGSETEAFTWSSGALVTGIAAGTALGGAIIGPDGVGAPFILSCLASALAAVCAVWAPRPHLNAAPAG